MDPQLLFQILSFVATGGQHGNPQSFFKFEMCSYPPASFDSSRLTRKANTPVLADAIWIRTKNEQTTKPTGKVHYVLDGGALLHRIDWPRGPYLRGNSLALCTTCDPKVQPGNGIALDGYEEGHPTKRTARIKEDPVSLVHQ